MRYSNLVEENAAYDSGTFTLEGARPGRRAFAQAALNPGERLHYHASSADAWELGVGEWGGGTDIIRSHVMASSEGTSAVDFTEEVVIALVGSAGSMLVIDGSTNESAMAHGTDALAAGPEAEAWGDLALALGSGAKVGSESFPRERGTAMGSAALVQHEGASAFGSGSRSAIPFARHGRQSYEWSGDRWTSDATPMDIHGPDASPIDLPEGTTIVIHALVMAQRNPGGAVYAAEIRAVVRRAYSSDATLVGSPAVTEIEKSGGVTVQATISAGSGGRVAVQVTGAASENWAWGATVRGAFIWP